jgi:hypothetical protein
MPSTCFKDARVKIASALSRHSQVVMASTFPLCITGQDFPTSQASTIQPHHEVRYLAARSFFFPRASPAFGRSDGDDVNGDVTACDPDGISMAGDQPCHHSNDAALVLSPFSYRDVLRLFE